jgi:hypothetical protein
MHPTTKLLVLFCVAAAAAAFSSPTGHAAGGTGAARCVRHEREALLEFKGGISTDRPYWPARLMAARWRPGLLQLEEASGAATAPAMSASSIHLRNVHANNTVLIDDSQTALVGQISPSLLSLRHLVHLDLSVQELQGPTGQVPEFLGSFKKLRYLNA